MKPRELPQFGTAGASAPAAVLAAAPAVSEEALPEGLKERLLHQRQALMAHLASDQWVPDLAEDIGSARWFKGLGTMLGLALCALWFWPDSDALAGLPAMPLDSNAREEFRSQMIQPLALGADTGRRMGATLAAVPAAGVPERSSQQFTATLGQGDSFERMLARAGLNAEDAAAVSRLIGNVIPTAQIEPGTQVDVALTSRDGGPRMLDHLAFRARFDLDLSVKRVGGQLQLSQHAITVDTTPLRIRGTVGSSLYLSARAAGAPIEAIQEYLSTIDQHMSLDATIEPGDTFDIILAYRRASSGETRVGELLYAGLERDGRPKAQLLRWGKDGQFFEASGMGQQRTGLIMPVVGGRITSNFGARRHPVLGYTRMHAGVDFGAGYGSPIYAVGDGRVSFSGWHGGHGNYVKLDHGGGYATAYAHMSRIAVASGTPVRAGQVIGYVGSTGLSTGPHLHYELYRNGTAVNPLSVRFTVSNQVDPGELSAYKARMAQLKQVKPGAAMQSLAPRQATVGPVGGHREIDKLAK
ncbi:M23 family metallopeptidase [Novosphingobium sp.]|uniref:M23 family metallopeptidase n=1 Tax=Novosphingobium sp. TaxID=1874826 RepID=UPI0025FC1884|nr:M23 family metallopeptidase [Novosphingobium sp.]